MKCLCIYACASLKCKSQFHKHTHKSTTVPNECFALAAFVSVCILLLLCLSINRNSFIVHILLAAPVLRSTMKMTHNTQTHHPPSVTICSCFYFDFLILVDVGIYGRIPIFHSHNLQFRRSFGSYDNK